jgi:hypothetical protein
MVWVDTRWTVDVPEGEDKDSAKGTTHESCQDIRPGHTTNTTRVRPQQHVDKVHKTTAFGLEMIMIVADRGSVTGRRYVGRGGVVCECEPHLHDWRCMTLCRGAAWAMCTGVRHGHDSHKRITWKWGRDREHRAARSLGTVHG